MTDIVNSTPDARAIQGLADEIYFNSRKGTRGPNAGISVEAHMEAINPMLLKELLMDRAYVNSAFYRTSRWSHILEPYIRCLAYKDLKLAKELISSNHENVIKTAFSFGLYESLQSLDSMIHSDNEEVRILVAQFCTVEAAREMKSDKSSKVRKIVFQRLGPSECLDLMLKDPKAEIRSDGVSFAPFGYDGLNKMTGEIAHWPFYKLVEKISADYLPMILGNRNVKGNARIADLINQRMNIEAGVKNE